MCGRYGLNAQTRQIIEMLGSQLDPVEESFPEIVPRYNIAPSQPLLAVVARDHPAHGHVATHFAWGFIPGWSKDPRKYNFINARSETVATSKSFGNAFRRRRCLIPATGFYEWMKTRSGKQPYYIHMTDERPFAFAGIWEHWMSADGSELETCAILTTEPNELIRPIHNRMPVIIPPADYAEWLQRGEHRPTHLLRPHPSEPMSARMVSRHVNSPANDDPSCMEGVEGFA